MKYRSFVFPCGEPHVVIEPPIPAAGRAIDMEWNFTEAADVVELMLIADALRRGGASIGTLTIPYFPFARQDRVNVPGEPLSVAVMADLVNGLGARRVVVTDPHSDVVAALVRNCVVVPQHEVFVPVLGGWRDFYLVSPDAGALKKIHKLAAAVKPLGVVECSKQRDPATGEITETRVVHPGQFGGEAYVIVDDICDGGRTFVEIAKVMRARGAGKIAMMVTHGFFTKGLGVFDGLIDEVYTRKGRVK